MDELDDTSPRSDRIVKLQQRVKVRVVEVDIPRKRIAFSMKGL